MNISLKLALFLPIGLSAIVGGLKLTSAKSNNQQTTDNWDPNRYLPWRIAPGPDSIIGVVFFPSAAPFFIKKNQPNIEDILKILKDAKETRSLVYIKRKGSQITDVKPAPKELSDAFRKGLKEVKPTDTTLIRHFTKPVN